ncbi:Methylenetetrahydrofolate dehydrogenase / Methenyltetrahydrofolate cyclohydrolase [Candidatus Xenohaliotis californiensis]|uniref:Bifunctional protein FolD n=1 Tax=Candidatus Xenohaliotis californiensis TaxID=84677 RepID=A0ABM9N997_9RICK|nr:Methylenetetrahydrofolate dehydrogenase / Methenyltetrahydrofolate cyclohydrolase [Candidatus Xenohaliotis californiensis]
MVYIIDGKEIANKICTYLQDRVTVMYAKYREVPCLAVVIIGDDDASLIYVANKKKRAESLGMRSMVYKFPSNVLEDEVLQTINRLNNDNNIHGILLQLPLPVYINKNNLIDLIHPNKDVDGLGVHNSGLLFSNRVNEALIPCTPHGCMILIELVTKKLSGKKVVVIGKSNIVGNPLAQLLLQTQCTVTVAHSMTYNLQSECRDADIVISATGCPGLIKSSYVKKGAIVIDVGISRRNVAGKSVITGDVDFADVSQVASAITPVPGGVGPMTIACLMFNTIVATTRKLRIGNNFVEIDAALN